MEALTAILVLITAVYAFLTYRILEANKQSVCHMERQIEEATRPQVLVYPTIREGSGIYELEITNLGKSTAHDVQIHMDREFFMFGEKSESSKVSNLPVFRKGMPSMAPGFRIAFYLGNPIDMLDEKKDTILTPLEFTISTTYKNASGKKYSDDYFVDLRVFDHSATRFGDVADNLKKIADELGEIRRRIKG